MLLLAYEPIVFRSLMLIIFEKSSAVVVAAKHHTQTKSAICRRSPAQKEEAISVERIGHSELRQELSGLVRSAPACPQPVECKCRQIFGWERDRSRGDARNGHRLRKNGDHHHELKAFPGIQHRSDFTYTFMILMILILTSPALFCSVCVGFQ